MGVQLKLVCSLAAILIVSTILLGTSFAFREQRKLAALKREHLQYSAQLAGNVLGGIAPAERERAVGVWNRTVSTGPSYMILSSGYPDESRDSDTPSDFGSSEMMSTPVPIPTASDGENWRLIAAEPRPDRRALLAASIGEHVVAGLLLASAAILAAALACQWLVIRPVRWLVEAADTIAQGDDWEPIRPQNRRQDELGVLADHLAALSRRLASAVRSARHGSAYLVAVRVRRELDDPIRRLTVGLVTLEASIDGDREMKHQVQQMYDQLRVLNEVSTRLADISPDPEIAGSSLD